MDHELQSEMAAPTRHPQATRPSQPTLHRILKGLDCAALESAVSGWAEAVLSAEAFGLEAFAIDGKTLRGSARQGALESHLISALSHRLGIVMAQLGVSDKSYELGHVEPMIDTLVPKGRVVTADALHTHRDVAHRIIAAGGDYLLPVKDNQPLLRQNIALVFAPATTLADTITTARLYGRAALRMKLNPNVVQGCR